MVMMENVKLTTLITRLKKSTHFINKKETPLPNTLITHNSVYTLNMNSLIPIANHGTLYSNLHLVYIK